jgi:hypothetical protein
MSDVADEREAIARVRAYAQERFPDYPTQELVAVRFAIGWTVFPWNGPQDITTLRCGQMIFLIGDSGQIMEGSGSRPPGERQAEFIRRYGGESRE